MILWLAAVGLALVTVAGTIKGLDAGVSPVVAVAMGIGGSPGRVARRGLRANVMLLSVPVRLLAEW